ncbi:hypothetical protein DFH09DRAFT_1287225 [Mycena vulgaris]|nr:hypothetical protein DFH09DRAFT_1287225 [Mycena vulgaris]
MSNELRGFQASRTRCCTPAPHRAQRPPAVVVNGSFIPPRRRPPSPTRGTTHIEGFATRTRRCARPAPPPPSAVPRPVVPAIVFKLKPPSHDRTALPGSHHPAGAAIHVQTRASRGGSGSSRDGKRALMLGRGAGVVPRTREAGAGGLRGGDPGCVAEHYEPLDGVKTTLVRLRAILLALTLLRRNPAVAMAPPTSRLRLHALKNDPDLRDAYGIVIAQVRRQAPVEIAPARISDSQAPHSATSPPLPREPPPAELALEHPRTFRRSGASRTTKQNDLAAGPRIVALQSALDDLCAYAARVKTPARAPSASSPVVLARADAVVATAHVEPLNAIVARAAPHPRRSQGLPHRSPARLLPLSWPRTVPEERRTANHKVKRPRRWPAVRRAAVGARRPVRAYAVRVKTPTPSASSPHASSLTAWIWLTRAARRRLPPALPSAHATPRRWYRARPTPSWTLRSRSHTTPPSARAARSTPPRGDTARGRRHRGHAAAMARAIGDPCAGVLGAGEDAGAAPSSAAARARAGELLARLLPSDDRGRDAPQRRSLALRGMARPIICVSRGSSRCRSGSRAMRGEDEHTKPPFGARRRPVFALAEPLDALEGLLQLLDDAVGGYGCLLALAVPAYVLLRAEGAAGWRAVLGGEGIHWCARILSLPLAAGETGGAGMYLMYDVWYNEWDWASARRELNL